MTSLLPYYITYQLDMEAQVPLVLLVMLGTIGLFLYPWKIVADRINKGPAYALGLAIACAAVIATFFLPYGPTTGERREGIYYGVWAFLTKFTGALGIAVSGWALDLFGYVPNVLQTDQARLGIRLFFGPVPAIAILISLPLLIWYPITRASHRTLREELEAHPGTPPAP